MSVIDLQAYAPCCELKILLWLEVSLIMLTIYLLLTPEPTGRLQIAIVWSI